MQQKLRFELPFYDPQVLRDRCAGKNWCRESSDILTTATDEFWETITNVFRLTMEKRFGDELKRP